MNFHFKVWLEKDGQPVIGDGLYYLLKKIEQYGSIKKAAESLTMSYRQAWGNIKKAESRLGTTLLIKQVGGEAGGGARLTLEAKELMKQYGNFRREVEACVQKTFEKHFK
ncbi:putative ModE family transcriptional regulator [Thermincola ferriacetica]|uniref:Putative ModE family transcriptional regulator n=1 Tax=Thermincola ferriacetica TaxID=281456 RepID=A0A0L6W0B8_9FIRM|nr:LysR family transcriptional regulator [Thermincola ferriacetica]KNZ69022.1 putative ModE family transcriptional regulator [Thermincola ferriacetica]